MTCNTCKTIAYIKDFGQELNEQQQRLCHEVMGDIGCEAYKVSINDLRG